jgi:hypothetical protein
MVTVNELKLIFSNQKADIPVFYAKIAKDSVKAKLLYGQILIAQTMYHWSDTATVANLKLALRRCTIDWQNYMKDT